MVIDSFHVMGTVGCPDKIQTKLVVDANAVLAFHRTHFDDLCRFRGVQSILPKVSDMPREIHAVMQKPQNLYGVTFDPKEHEVAGSAHLHRRSYAFAAG